ncbi:hypothetical protein, partial [Paenibacillus aquistagni]|uniref:hypothetical protein n=1 Tax=Paenibacillus aquistagni TaxID=1852522 RepID=UPI001C6FCD4C
YGRRSKVLKKIGNRSFECIFSRSSKENRLSWRIYKVTSSILGGFWFGHRKTSPSWGEAPFLCLKNLEYQGLKLMQNAQIK